MSYSLFLVLFVCLPLAGLVYLMRDSLRNIHLLMILLIALIAMVYTTPWDNYLVASGVWSYDLNLILKDMILGYVPLEEYVFFVLQTFLTGVFVFWLWRRFYPADFAHKSEQAQKRKDR